MSELLTAEQVLAEVDDYCTNGAGNPILAPLMRDHYKKHGHMAHAVLASLNLEPVTMWRRKGATCQSK
jgi:hypothetical protein